MTPQSQLPGTNDWGSHYLLENYDMKSLFRGVKSLCDTGYAKTFIYSGLSSFDDISTNQD